MEMEMAMVMEMEMAMEKVGVRVQERSPPLAAASLAGGEELHGLRQR